MYRLGANIKPGLVRSCCVGSALFFCLAVGLKLNGSSVGMWRNLLTEPGIARGLILSSPKHLRVDEWAIWTPAMLSQARQNPPFPIENPSLGAGRAPLLMSVPVAYYTTFFRPQLWGFFVFDFEHGFSFYWCTKVFGLLLAVAWALRQIGVRSYLLAIFGAIWVLFSSYVQWWFSSPGMLPEMITTWAICLGCAVSFFKDQHRGKLTLALASFIFCGTNFVLCLYPPYQIPLTLLMLAILIGVWLENCDKQDSKSTIRALLLIGTGLLAIAIMLIPYWIDVRGTLETVAHTVYPGQRRSAGGDLSLFKLFAGVLGFFESEQTVPAVYDNICEASNFYPLWPAVVLATLFARFRNRTRISPLLATLSIFLICFGLYCVMPLPAWLLRATLLDLATERRALLAIGLANIFLCCFFLDRYRASFLSKTTAGICGAVLWLGVVFLLLRGRTTNAVYFSDPWHWIQPLAISAAILLLFFWEALRFRWLPTVLGTLLIFSNAAINPVMSGLGPLLGSNAFKEIDRIRAQDPDGKWIIYHTRYFAQLVKATGAPVFNGTMIVPDLALLHQLDSGANESTYNRYANIGCEVPRKSHEVSASLVYPDFYILFLPPDLPVLANAGYRYILFPKEWTDGALYGFTLIEKITPGDLWIYRHD